MKLSVEVQVATLGRKFLAVTRLGGVTVRGRPADEAESAVRNLFWRLAGQDSSEDAEVALSMALAGTTVDASFALDAAKQ